MDGTETWGASEDRVKDRVDPFSIFNVLSSVMSLLEEMVARTPEPSYAAKTRVEHDLSCSVLTAIGPYRDWRLTNPLGRPSGPFY
jgi:hypothetical protein